ncbi:rho GTPase-activating protein 25 isoform X2 [Pseudophryne corroboree]|uniref:rho GTPase-activating protein 25 isoform X2 n=1 Tax=Pseudophryne corroboree TaxID=495146 RepID=UPI0030816929
MPQWYGKSGWDLGCIPALKMRLICLALRRKRVKLSQRAVFGQRLVDTIAYEKKYGRHLVPILIEKCADFILEKGLNEEGIFRLPGQDNLVKQLKEAFDAGERPSFSMDTDVHTVASLFKLYLRELPEPVVPWSQYENYLACERTISVDEEKGHQELMMQIKILPKENYNLLSFICRFLYEVQKNSGVNKMSIDNLAMVIGVNLLKPKTEEPVALMTGAPQIQKLMTVMISHQDKFFPKTNDLLIESKTQKNDPKNMQMPRSSVGWDAAEDSVSPLGDSPNAHLRHYSHGSSISDDSLSLKEEDDCSLLPNNSESWQMYSRKRTQTLPTTSFIMSQKLGGNSPNSLKEEIFSSEFWSSPYGQKAYLSTSPGHKRTLSEEISQHRRSTYDNVPCPQDESGKNTRTGAVNESTVSGDVKKPAGQQSPNYLRNGVYCLITDNQDDNNCGRLASALEEMTIQQKILEDRMKSLEKENFDVWKKVVKLNEDLEKERNQRKALEITLQNMERSRDDAERRNKQLEQEIQGFVRAMSQAGNKP